jgi:hypothetical protein
MENELGCLPRKGRSIKILHKFLNCKQHTIASFHFLCLNSSTSPFEFSLSTQPNNPTKKASDRGLKDIIHLHTKPSKNTFYARSIPTEIVTLHALNTQHTPFILINHKLTITTISNPKTTNPPSHPQKAKLNVYSTPSLLQIL